MQISCLNEYLGEIHLTLVDFFTHFTQKYLNIYFDFSFIVGHLITNQQTRFMFFHHEIRLTYIFSFTLQFIPCKYTAKLDFFFDTFPFFLRSYEPCRIQIFTSCFYFKAATYKLLLHTLPTNFGIYTTDIQGMCDRLLNALQEHTTFLPYKYISAY